MLPTILLIYYIEVYSNTVSLFIIIWKKGIPYSNNHYASDLVGLLFLSQIFPRIIIQKNGGILPYLNFIKK
jgi:hypothetical protein